MTIERKPAAFGDMRVPSVEAQRADARPIVGGDPAVRPSVVSGRAAIRSLAERGRLHQVIKARENVGGHVSG